MTDEPEVGTFSLWFMRGALGVTALVVLAFLVHAASGLFDGDEEPAGEVSDPVADAAEHEQATAEPADPAEAPDTADPADAPDPADSDDAPDPGDTAESGPTRSADPELAAFVDEAMEFIEAVRGRPFLAPPEVRVAAEAEFLSILRDDLAETFAEDPELVRRTTVTYRALGLIEPDASIDTVYSSFVEAGVLGVYFPELDHLVVRDGAELSLLAKSTIVHELVHAYDDQYFDLDRVGDQPDDTELPWTMSAAVEGSASYVEHLWVDRLSDADQATLQAEQLAFGDVDLLLEFDLSFLLLEISVYEYGREWISRIVEADGIEAIDAALQAPAATSEQVIEPLDAPGRSPIAVDLPAVEGEVVWQGPGGQALLDALFAGSFVDGGDAAATGWGGDAMTVYEADGRSCIRWDIATDSPSDGKELVNAMTEWTAVNGGQVVTVGDLVRLDRCA